MLQWWQGHVPSAAPRLVSPYTSSVETLITRLIVGAMRHDSSSTCVPAIAAGLSGLPSSGSNDSQQPPLVAGGVSSTVGVVHGEGQAVAERVVNVRLHASRSGGISAARVAHLGGEAQGGLACAAKCMTVSISSVRRMKLRRSADCRSPWMNCRGAQAQAVIRRSCSQRSSGPSQLAAGQP